MELQSNFRELSMTRHLKPGQLCPDRERPGTEGRGMVVVWGLLALTVASAVWLMFGAPI
jgi:hypothetical protein